MPSTACVAVNVVVPTPTMVIVDPLTVATLVLLDVYVMAPALGDVGGVMVGAAAPYTTLDELSEKPDNVGLMRLTVKLTVLVVAATELLASLTAKTRLEVAKAPFGVPVTAPVVELSERPDGNVPELR